MAYKERFLHSECGYDNLFNTTPSLTDYWDIGYNYLVGSDGRAYQGRGWWYEGAHTSGHNRDAVAITAIGDFQKKRPDRAVRKAIANLIDCALKEVCLVLISLTYKVTCVCVRPCARACVVYYYVCVVSV